MALWARLGKMTVMLSLAAYACGGKTNMADTTCEPGATVDCSASCPGQRVCLADGSGWSECSCGYGGSGYGGSGYGGSGYGGSGYGGSGYGGGYGGGVYGGTGGIGYGGSSYGGTGAVGSCFDECPGYKLAGLIDMQPCCAPDDACGAYVDATIGSITSLVEGCYPLDQPGAIDNHCPSKKFINPIDGQPAEFVGCCRPSGLCGIEVDLTPAEGPYLGCSDSGTGSGAEPCGSGDECSNCVLTNCQVEVSNCLAAAGCAEILFCTQNCSNSTCVQNCMSASPTGMPAFSSVLACSKQKCFAECPSLFGG
jgi:hypothetical protein